MLLIAAVELAQSERKSEEKRFQQCYELEMSSKQDGRPAPLSTQLCVFNSRPANTDTALLAALGSSSNASHHFCCWS